MRHFFLMVGLILGVSLFANEAKLIDPAPLRDSFLPSGPVVPRKIVPLGDQGFYLDYGVSGLIVSSDYFLSELTLIQLFLNEQGESLPLLSEGLERHSSEQKGMERSVLFLGGELSLSLLKPQNITFKNDVEQQLTLDETPPFPVIHFGAGGAFFWLGNGKVYCIYDRQGSLMGKYTLWIQSGAILYFVDSLGQLILALNDGTILILSPDSVGLPSEGEAQSLSTEIDLFLSFYGEAERYLKREHSYLEAAFYRWARERLEKLYSDNPLNSELGRLLRELRELDS